MALQDHDLAPHDEPSLCIAHRMASIVPDDQHSTLIITYLSHDPLSGGYIRPRPRHILTCRIVQGRTLTRFELVRQRVWDNYCAGRRDCIGALLVGSERDDNGRSVNVWVGVKFFLPIDHARQSFVSGLLYLRPFPRPGHVGELFFLITLLPITDDQIELHALGGYATETLPKEDFEKGTFHIGYHVITPHRGGDVSDTLVQLSTQQTKYKGPSCNFFPLAREQPKEITKHLSRPPAHLGGHI